MYDPYRIFADSEFRLTDKGVKKAKERKTKYFAIFDTSSDILRRMAKYPGMIWRVSEVQRSISNYLPTRTFISYYLLDLIKEGLIEEVF